jgi:hypothetical protein
MTFATSTAAIGNVPFTSTPAVAGSGTRVSRPVHQHTDVRQRRAVRSKAADDRALEAAALTLRQVVADEDAEPGQLACQCRLKLGLAARKFGLFHLLFGATLPPPPFDPFGRPAPTVPDFGSNPGLRLFRLEDRLLAAPERPHVLAEPLAEIARFAWRVNEEPVPMREGLKIDAAVIRQRGEPVAFESRKSVRAAPSHG